MSVRFQQPLINIRERLNHLFNHRHDAEYEKKGTYIGKNLLINGDKTVSQRGDFSTPFSPVPGAKHVDKYIISYNFSDISITYEHKVYDVNINARPVRITATSSNGTAAAFFTHEQYIRFFNPLLDSTVTYTANVKSNSSKTVLMANGEFSSPHSGSGEYELLSVTVRIPVSVVTVSFGVYSSKDGGTVVDDYIEIGNEQTEIGNKFTKFELISQAKTMLDCRRYFIPITTANPYDTVGLFVAVSTTLLRFVTSVQPAHDVVPLLGNNDHLTAFTQTTTSSGTMTQGTLTVNQTLTDIVNGRLVLELDCTGYTVGETALIAKNNATNILGIDLDKV